MSHIIQLEVPDPLFKAIELRAAAQGSDPASIAMSALERHFQPIGNSTSSVSDGNSFEALFGAIDLGHPTGLDNEEIDADLAREYARGLTD